MFKRSLLLYNNIIRKIYKKILAFEYILRYNKYNKKNLFKFIYCIIYIKNKVYDSMRVNKPP